MIENWSLVEADFQQFYSIDLEQALPRKTFRWFLIRAAGLMSIESRLNRALRAETETGEPDV